MIEQQEREVYEAVRDGIPAYANNSPGEQLVQMFFEMSSAHPRATVLDAGCCTGKGGVVLAKVGMRVTLCDLVDSRVEEAQALPFKHVCLWRPISEQLAVGPFGNPRHDYVYCCDVLEHIPAQYVMLTLTRLLDHARKGVFLSICTVADNFGVWLGRPLHQTVQPFTWWRDQLKEIGNLKESRDLLTFGVYYVEPK